MSEVETKLKVTGRISYTQTADVLLLVTRVRSWTFGLLAILFFVAFGGMIVYKLVELNETGRIKLSAGKKTYPLGKQIFRRRDDSGRIVGDHITKADEIAEGEPQLKHMVVGGRLASSLPDLDTIRERCRAQIVALPDYLRGLNAKPAFPLTYSDRLEDEARRLGVKSP